MQSRICAQNALINFSYNYCWSRVFLQLITNANGFMCQFMCMLHCVASWLRQKKKEKRNKKEMNLLSTVRFMRCHKMCMRDDRATSTLST